MDMILADDSLETLDLERFASLADQFARLQTDIPF